jgi:citrate synthase
MLNAKCSMLQEVLMAQAVSVKNTGLRGVAVADTKISFIDAEKGVLIYRGYRIEELAERSTFAEVAYLLLNGSLPGAEELLEFREVARSLFRYGTQKSYREDKGVRYWPIKLEKSSRSIILASRLRR